YMKIIRSGGILLSDIKILLQDLEDDFISAKWTNGGFKPSTGEQNFTLTVGDDEYRIKWPELLPYIKEVIYRLEDDHKLYFTGCRIRYCYNNFDDIGGKTDFDHLPETLGSIKLGDLLISN